MSFNFEITLQPTNNTGNNRINRIIGHITPDLVPHLAEHVHLGIAENELNIERIINLTNLNNRALIIAFLNNELSLNGLSCAIGYKNALLKYVKFFSKRLTAQDIIKKLQKPFIKINNILTNQPLNPENDLIKETPFRTIPNDCYFNQKPLSQLPLGVFDSGKNNLLLLPDPISTTAMKMYLMEHAEHEILLSGSYCQGDTFERALNIIEHKITENPSFQAYILYSNHFATGHTLRTEELQKKYPLQFHCSITKTLNYKHLADLPLPSTIKLWEKIRISNHAKILVVDGNFIIGGSALMPRWEVQNGIIPPENANDSKNHLDIASPDRWIARGFRDVDVYIENVHGHNLSLALREQFFKLFSFWKYQETGILLNKENMPPFRYHSTSVLKDLIQQTDHKTITPLVQCMKASGLTPETSVLNEGHVKLLVTGPGHATPVLEKEIIQLFDEAKTNIRIHHMYFHLTIDIFQALTKAAQRGVKIELITNGYHESSPEGNYTFSRHTLACVHLLRHALHIHGIDQNRFEVWLWNVADVTNHDKLIMTDEEKVIMGSSNLGLKSMVTHGDFEMNVVIKQKNFYNN